MANSFMTNVSENFDIQAMAVALGKQYQAKGFNVRMAKMRNGVKISLDKNCGGINMLLGLGLGITATCMVQGDTLMVNYTDGDWTGKWIGLGVGWLLCLVPFITAAIGAFKQLDLPKQINMDIQMLVGNNF